MLAREHRLPPSVLVKGARSISTPYFLLRVVTNNLSVSRFGFLLSKKNEKTAVGRNTTKRRLRSCVEKRLADIKPGLDMLFVIKKDAVTADTHDLCATLEKVFAKERLFAA